MRVSQTSSPQPPLKAPVVPETATPAASPVAKAAKPAGLGDRARDLVASVGGVVSSAGTFVRHLFQPSGSWHNPNLPVPADKGGLTVMSFNVMVKTTRYDAVKRDLAKHAPDVVCLQETSEATARRLAEELGYHVAWHENPLHGYGDTAILSKYPIQAAETIDLAGSFGDRFGEFWRNLKGGEVRGSALNKRHMTHATIAVGDRKIDVLSGHLTLNGLSQNTMQVDQIAKLARGYEQQGHSVLVAGDWNTNLAIHGDGRADAKGAWDSATDTNAEFRDRHPGRAVGHQGNAENLAALDRLRSGLNDFWDAPNRTVLVDGTLMTPEQALAELKSGKVDPTSDRHAALVRAADGSTLMGASKRFDAVLASKDLRFESAHIDQTTEASDHQPVVTEVRWGG
jgi:endonuclease/exonuclease/phosphatase family metal-dependent hydrolase